MEPIKPLMIQDILEELEKNEAQKENSGTILKSRLEGKNGLDAVYQASSEGDTMALQVFLERDITGRLVNAFDKTKGWTLLFFACRENNRETVQHLLKNGAHTDEPTLDDQKQTPLHISALEGYVEIMTDLLSSGARIDVRDGKERTALHLAAEKGQDEAVEFLLERGLDPRVKDSEGQTCLHLAAKGNHFSVVKKISEYMNNLGGVDTCGKTALNYANHFDIINFLIGKRVGRTNTDNEKVDVNFWTEKLGFTPARCVSYLNNLKRYNDPIVCTQEEEITKLDDNYVFKRFSVEELGELLSHQ